MQKSVLFAKKNLKINIWKIKTIVKLEIIVIGEYRGVPHNICNLKYSVPKKIPIVFHNWWKSKYKSIYIQFICLFGYDIIISTKWIYSDCLSFYTCFLAYGTFKNDLIEYKRLCWNKSYQHKCDEKLQERFFNTQNYFNHDNNKFILLLQKGFYPYEYMDDWKKLNETSLHEKEDFYCHLNVEDITDADCARAKRVGKDFEIKNLAECHDLYV